MAHGRPPQIVNMAPEPTGHMGKQQAKMNTNVDSSIFDLFAGLNSPSEEKQADSTAKLVQHFSENRNSVKNDDGSLSQEVSYTLKRLIRGLGSEKPHILKSYYSALSCLLAFLSDINCEEIKDVIEKELSNTAGLVSKDKKEVLIARTIAWGALMRSGLFQKASLDEQQNIFNDLLTCSRKKSYLPLAAYSFLVDMIPTMESSSFRNTVWPLVKKEVKKPWESQTLDSLLLLLVCRKHHPNVVKAKFLSKNLGTDEVMTKDTMGYFAQQLLFSTYLKHPLYRVFCGYLSEPDAADLLEKFWCVEMNKLMSSIKNKDLAILELVTNMVESIGPNDNIALLLTDEIIAFLNRTLSDVYKKQFPEVQAKAHKTVVLLGSVLTNPEASDKLRLAVLKALLTKSSNLQFEKCQNLERSTHIITILIGLLESDSAKELAQIFKSVLTSVSQKQHVSKKDLVFAVQQFSRLVYQTTINDTDWRVDQLKFLVQQFVFKNKRSELIDDVSVTLRQSFFKTLGMKLPTLENLLEVLTTLVNYVQELLASGRTLKVHLRPDSLDAWEKMLAVVKKIKDSQPGSVQQIFHLLFLYMGLYLFTDALMAEDALKELHSCYEHSGSNSRSKRKSITRKDEPHWVEVTVDLLLSLLSHGSHLLRTVVGIVFSHLRKHITLPALQQILEALHPGESENTLTIVDDANAKGQEDEDSSDEATDLNGETNAMSEEDNSDESSFEIDEDSDLEDESLDEEESISDQLRSEIRDVLGNMASDNESVDIDEADEEELHRVDEALKKAFQSMQNKRQGQRNKKDKKQSKVDELLMHFRLRVLDLIDIFLAKQPSFSLVLHIIQPLISLLEFSSRDVHMKTLATKVRSLLSKISSFKKFTSLDDVTKNDIAELLGALINKGNRTAAVFLETVDVVTNCCTMLVRCSEHLPVTGKTNEVTDVCKAALDSFLTKRDCLLPCDFFRSILTLQWEGCHELADMLVKGAFDTELRPIRRMQSAELLGVLLKNTRLMKSENEHKFVRNLTSAIITNAVELFQNNSTKSHLQQKYLVELYRVLHNCLTLQKASSEEVSKLNDALTKFWVGSPPHGDAKKPGNELRRALNPVNKREAKAQKKAKAAAKEQAKRKSIVTNGDDVEHSEEAAATCDETRTEASTTMSSKKKKKKVSLSPEESGNTENVLSQKDSTTMHSKKKKSKLSFSLGNSGNTENHLSQKKKRRKSQCQPDNESTANGGENLEDNIEVLVPEKKKKTVNVNGTCKEANISTQLVPSTSDRPKNRKKSKLSLTK